MKRCASPAWLLDRSLPWLAWWQELLINWIASWHSVGSITVVSSNGEDFAQWDLPSDIELKRQELEELLHTQHD